MTWKVDTRKPKWFLWNNFSIKKINNPSAFVHDKESPFFDVSPKNLAIKVFYPLYSISDWVKLGTTTRRLSVAILLPSGLSPDNFSVCASEDKITLTIAVTWPDLFINLKYLCGNPLFFKGSNWIKTYHPMLLRFDRFLKTRIYGSRNTDSEEPIAKNLSSFQIQTHIFWK